MCTALSGSQPSRRQNSLAFDVKTLDPDLRPKAAFQQRVARLASESGGFGGLFASGLMGGALQKTRDEQVRRDALRKLYADQATAAEQQIAQMQEQAVQAQEAMAAQQAQQAQNVATLREQQTRRVGEIRAAGQAASRSLRILSQSGGQQGPTAASAGRVPVAGGARRTAASLRMGATSRGSGSGANVSV